MDDKIINKMISICEEKINKKWLNVWLSFYAFFENKNTQPKTLMEVAKWWIEENKFDHFEKAEKIKNNLIQLKKD